MAKKILVADDSITIQKLITLTFADENYELEIVDNGEEALRKAREIKPDLVIADVTMPGMDGYELTYAIKTTPGFENIPVLLLTGTFETFDEEKAAKVGADDHISKPFETRALIDKVNELLSLPPDQIKKPQLTEEITPREEKPAFEEVEFSPEAIAQETFTPSEEIQPPEEILTEAPGETVDEYGLEEVEEIEEIEEVGESETLEEIEPVTEAEESEGVQPLEELEEIEEVTEEEELQEVEEVESTQEEVESVSEQIETPLGIETEEEAGRAEYDLEGLNSPGGEEKTDQETFQEGEEINEIKEPPEESLVGETGETLVTTEDKIAEEVTFEEAAEPSYEAFSGAEEQREISSDEGVSEEVTPSEESPETSKEEALHQEKVEPNLSRYVEGKEEITVVETESDLESVLGEETQEEKDSAKQYDLTEVTSPSKESVTEEEFQPSEEITEGTASEEEIFSEEKEEPSTEKEIVISDRLPEEVSEGIEEGVEEKIETATPGEPLLSVEEKEIEEQPPEEEELLEAEEAYGEFTPPSEEEKYETETEKVTELQISEEKLTPLIQEKIENLLKTTIEGMDIGEKIAPIIEEKVTSTLQKIIPEIIYKSIEKVVREEIEKLEKEISS